MLFSLVNHIWGLKQRSQPPNKIAYDANSNSELDKSSDADTVYYLAYGSNLCANTFRRVRGITPLSQVNVVVPELKLTFDLPGIPYTEPCFANTEYRVAPNPSDMCEQATRATKYRKDRWCKGLVGVVYEVTNADYAKLIATEGGGGYGYRDIVVDCYEIPAESEIVDQYPQTAPFKAHTLFAPALSRDRITRPDQSYAQPSARYLKLLTDGAEENALPLEYRDYLYQIRPYTITSTGQQIGRLIFLSLRKLLFIVLFKISKIVSDENGLAPQWMTVIMQTVFVIIWSSYSSIFKVILGDGERTQGCVGECDADRGEID